MTVGMGNEARFTETSCKALVIPRKFITRSRKTNVLPSLSSLAKVT